MLIWLLCVNIVYSDFYVHNFTKFILIHVVTLLFSHAFDDDDGDDVS